MARSKQGGARKSTIAKAMNESNWDRFSYVASMILGDVTTTELERLKEIIEQEVERRKSEQS